MFSLRSRDGARGNRGGSRGGGAPRAGKREFDRRGGRPAAGAKGTSEADAVLQSAIEAEALAPTDGETPAADAAPQEPEPEDVSLIFPSASAMCTRVEQPPVGVVLWRFVGVALLFLCLSCVSSRYSWAQSR